MGHIPVVCIHLVATCSQFFETSHNIVNDTKSSIYNSGKLSVCLSVE